MRLEVDESLPRAGRVLLQRAGHDAISVGEQGLSGADDARVHRLRQDEQRALITLAHRYAGDGEGCSGRVGRG